MQQAQVLNQLNLNQIQSSDAFKQMNSQFQAAFTSTISQIVANVKDQGRVLYQIWVVMVETAFN